MTRDCYAAFLSVFRNKAEMIALSLTRNLDEAQDLVSLASYKMLCMVSGVNEATADRLFIVIIRNAFLDSRRSHLRRFSHSLDEKIGPDSESQTFAEILPGHDTMPLDDLVQIEARNIVTKCLNKMPASYRDTLYLTYILGHNYDETSRMLRIPRGTVSSRMVRGRKIMSRLVRARSYFMSAGRREEGSRDKRGIGWTLDGR